MTASLSEDASSTARSEAQKVPKLRPPAASLAPTRASGARQAEIEGILIDPRLEGCVSINGPRTKEACPRVAELKTEVASNGAGHGTRQGRSSGFNRQGPGGLATLPAPRVANSDAKAVAQLLNALGYEPTVAQVNTALALLSVLLIEMGGSVSLAVGMALTNTPVEQSVSAPLPQPLPHTPCY